MKILVIYASAGTGHRRAAEAIYNYLIEKKEHELKLIDALNYSNYFFKNLYSNGYTFLVSKFSFIWYLLFQFSNLAFFLLFVKILRFYFNRINLIRLNKFILNFNPDIIVSAHFMANEVVTHLKKKYKIKSRLISIVTDFCVHRFWINDGVDKYIVCSDETKEELVNKGIGRDRVNSIGIPVDPVFYKAVDRKQVLQKLGLKEDKFTVLIITGTIGIGPIEEIVKELQGEDIQILVVCGNNIKLYNRLAIKKYNLTKLYGFVDNVDELMTISDLIITKPGALTISEAIIKNLPMIFITAIPGQEAANADFLQDKALGFKIANPMKIKCKILELKQNPKKLASIRKKIKEFSNLNTLEQIQNEICQNSLGAAC